MRRLSRFVLGRRRWVIAFWLLVLLGGLPNLQRATHAFSEGFAIPGRPGYETNQKLKRLYGIDPNTSSIVAVFQLPKRTSLWAPQARRDLGATLQRALGSVPGARYLSYDTTGSKVFLSPDRRTTFAVVYAKYRPDRGFGGASKEVEAVRAALARTHPPGWTVHVTGIDALTDSGGGGGPGVLAEALLGGVGALVVLAFVFASFVALVPLLLAVVAIVATFMLMWALTLVASVSFIVEFLVALVGLGVCIDYALLLVARWREERAHGYAGDEAVERALATAGKTIVFSGTTVGIGLLSLVVLPVPFLRSIGYAGMLIPLVSVLVAVTLLPAILASAGPWLDRPRLRTELEPPRLWVRWSGWVVRHRALAAVAALAMLVALAVPATRLQLGNASPDSLAKSGDAHAGLAALERAGVGAGALTEFQVLAPVYDASRAATRLARVDGVRGAAVAPWRSLSSPLAVVDVFPERQANGGSGRALYTRLRERAAQLPGVSVGGPVAGNADFVSAVYSNFPLMVGLIALLTLLLLARAFRSLLLPLKAVALNLLSVAAAWGVIVLVWQEGNGSHLIWGIPATGATTAFVPLMVFAFLFGLSMDYEVFILTRVREEYEATGSTDEAVRRGLARTGRLVTSAALILFLAFAALGSGPETIIKVFATGLAAGIVLDATVVRALLVPALVSLLGRRSWWLPVRKSQVRYQLPDLAEKDG